jgi:DNA-binding NtrC family response regulator
MAHLLLVDDDDDLVETLTEVLRVEGHHVRTASTGEEGLRVLRAAPLPDAVILDVDMPVLGGPGMAHGMLLHDAGEERIPVILVSAREDLPAIAQRMGTPYFVRKPCDINTFLLLLDRTLRERRPPRWPHCARNESSLRSYTAHRGR